jgi:uracil-DNA glycosylase family 4
MSQSLTQCQTQQLGARCDICPLRKGGELSGEEEWKPVGTERHQSATVIAIAESPGPEEVDRGRPLVGRSGGEWNDALRAVGKTRPEVDLTAVVLCKLPGQASGAWRQNGKEA